MTEEGGTVDRFVLREDPIQFLLRDRDAFEISEDAREEEVNEADLLLFDGLEDFLLLRVDHALTSLVGLLLRQSSSSGAMMEAKRRWFRGKRQVPSDGKGIPSV